MITTILIDNRTPIRILSVWITNLEKETKVPEYWCTQVELVTNRKVPATTKESNTKHGGLLQPQQYI